MHRLSAFIAKIETMIEAKFGRFISRHKGKFTVYIPLIICAWYFYGMFLNSIRLARAFHKLCKTVSR